MDAYRDPLAAIRGQLATKRAIVEEAARALAPLAIAMLGDEEGESFEAARKSTSRDGDSVEALLELERELDAVLDMIATMDRRWTLPEELILPEPPAEKEETLPGMAEVRRVLEAAFDGGSAEPFGSEAFLLRFFDGGTLFALVADAFPTERRGVLEVGHLALTLRASMPDGLPAFSLGPEMDVARYRLGTRQKIRRKLGAPPSPLPPERAFWISGHEAAARALIGDDVRLLLHTLLETCVLEPPQRIYPKLEADAGYVDLGYTSEWEGDDTEVVPAEALMILHGIRARAASRRAPQRL